MAVNTFKLEFDDGVNQSLEVVIVSPTDIVMFVAGTTDPGNTFGKKYDANSTYWTDRVTESKKNLWKKLKSFSYPDKQFNDLHISEEFFSWSGDNNTEERNVASERLFDLIMRLYGTTARKSKTHHLHLIGHSHGGNVINQFTELITNSEMIAKSKILKKNGIKEFPKLWEIKSITYLSTPFFNNKHQLNHTKIHKNCQIINVRNKYDITQRFVADFSLHNLEAIVGAFNGHEVTKAIDKIKLILQHNVYAQLKERWSIIDKEEGTLIWRRTVLLLENIIFVIDEVISTITTLKSSLSQEKQDLTNLLTNLRGLLETIRAEFDANTINRDGNYGTAEFLNDLELTLTVTPAVGILNRLFAITTGVKSSFILNTLAGIFDDEKGLTESIDDTSWSPKAQLQGNDKYDLEEIDITTKDVYSERGKETDFEDFVAAIERSISNKNLQEVLMRLFSQFMNEHDLRDISTKIDGWEPYVFGALDDGFKALRANINEYARLVGQFNADLVAEQDMTEEEREERRRRLAGEEDDDDDDDDDDVDTTIAFTPASINAFNTDYLEITNRKEKTKEEKKKEQENKPEAEPLRPGTVPYFATTAHSLSHSDLWPGVETKLRSAFSSGKNPGYQKQ